MEKKNLVATCMAIPGGILFSLGMVMALMTEWGLLIPGIVVGGVGLIVLALIYPIYRKVGKYPPIEVNKATVISYALGIIATLLFGAGMCLVMVDKNPVLWKMLVGIAVGIVGLVGMILNALINLSKKNRKDKENTLSE